MPHERLDAVRPDEDLPANVVSLREERVRAFLVGRVGNARGPEVDVFAAEMIGEFRLKVRAMDADRRRAEFSFR